MFASDEIHVRASEAAFLQRRALIGCVRLSIKVEGLPLEYVERVEPLLCA